MIPIVLADHEDAAASQRRASIRPVASAIVAVNGFSTSTCLPAFRAASAIARWPAVGRDGRGRRRPQCRPAPHRGWRRRASPQDRRIARRTGPRCLVRIDKGRDLGRGDLEDGRSSPSRSPSPRARPGRSWRGPRRRPDRRRSVLPSTSSPALTSTASSRISRANSAPPSRARSRPGRSPPGRVFRVRGRSISTKPRNGIRPRQRRNSRETHLSTVQARPQAPSRLPRPPCHQGRPQGPGRPPRAAASAFGLSRQGRIAHPSARPRSIDAEAAQATGLPRAARRSQGERRDLDAAKPRPSCRPGRAARRLHGHQECGGAVQRNRISAACAKRCGLPPPFISDPARTMW